MQFELDANTALWVLTLNRAVLFGVLVFLYARNKDVSGLFDWVIFAFLLFANSIVRITIDGEEISLFEGGNTLEFFLSALFLSLSYVFFARGFQKFSRRSSKVNFKIIIGSVSAICLLNLIFGIWPDPIFAAIIYIGIVALLVLALDSIYRLSTIRYFYERRLALISTAILAICYLATAILTAFEIVFDPAYIDVLLSVLLSLSVTIVIVSLIPLVVANRGRKLHTELRERKRLESSLSLALEQANAADRAKSHFLKNISHEMRTPLNAIIGFSDVLAKQSWGPLNEKQKEHVNFISTSGTLLLRVVEDLLALVNFDKNQSVKMVIKPCTVEDIFEDITPLTEKMLSDARSKLIKPDTSDLPLISADKLRVTQILINLISNAAKYGKAGEDITLTCDVIDEEMLKISIHDKGPGIAPDELQKIFEPFYRSNNQDPGIEGMGIGLSLTLAYVTEMRGKLGVDSDLEKGSTFWFTLPLAKNEAE